MSDLPWYMSLFNVDLLKKNMEQYEHEAKDAGMTLAEYLESKRLMDIPLDKEDTK